MANVTDSAFRQMFAKYGRPDVFFTEFISCDGLCSEGFERLKIELSYTEAERPLVLQLFGSTPEHFQRCAQLAQEYRFDGIDINMGCPDRAVEKQGGGAALIKNPTLAQDIIRATRAGAGDLPVSVKTRLGYSRDVLEDWIPALLETKLDAITIHARTRKEMSKVPARWERVARAVEIRNARGSTTKIIGNGDVENLEHGRRLAEQSGADGVMVGRGAFGNPWFFHPQRRWETITTEEKLTALIEHSALFLQVFGAHKNFEVMKKHYKAYVSGWPDAKELRVSLMSAKSFAEVTTIVAEYRSGLAKT